MLPGVGSFARGNGTSYLTWPEIRRDYPLNLSILVSGGRETNEDSLSNGERTGKSPAPNPPALAVDGTCGVWDRTWGGPAGMRVLLNGTDP